MAESNLLALCSVEDFLKHDYDFIVVGGGTERLVVAARLTESPNVHVGVLEAGAAHWRSYDYDASNVCQDYWGREI